MEHEPRAAGLVPGDAADAEEELAAVLRIRVLREGAGGGVGGALHQGVMKSFKRRFAKFSHFHTHREGPC